MPEPVIVSFKGRRYVWDGKHWFDEEDCTVPPQSIQVQLARLVPADQYTLPIEDRRGQVSISCGDFGYWKTIAVAEVLSNGRLNSSSTRSERV